MMNSQTSFAWVSLPVLSLGIGILLILLAVFWKKLHFERTAFAARLNEIASHPALWIAVVTIVWFSTWALNMTKEVRQNNEIVMLRNDVQSMARVIDRGVLPRHLNKRQQVVISNFLLQFEPHEFAFQLPNRDEEAGSYRVDIEQALEKGGWTRSEQNPYDYTDSVPEGLSINFIQTQEHSQRPDDPRNPKADRLLMMALGLGGVRLNQTGGGGGGPNVTVDRLVIGIGRRRMDSYELTPPDNFLF